jgi:hypothetical protein
MLRDYEITRWRQARYPAVVYEGVEGLLTKVIAGRFGSGLGAFFFGFFTSRLRASLFPMLHRMPQFLYFATVSLVCQSRGKCATPSGSALKAPIKPPLAQRWLPRLKREGAINHRGQAKTRQFTNRWRFCSPVRVKYPRRGEVV